MSEKVQSGDPMAPLPRRRGRPLTDARDNILKASLEEFAEKGFDKSSLRSIGLRCDSKEQLVRYHFGDKNDLYELIWFKHYERPELNQDKGYITKNIHEGASLEESLRIVTRQFVRGAVELLSMDDNLNFPRIFYRESADPNAKKRGIFAKCLGPTHSAFLEVFCHLLPHWPEPQVLMALTILQSTTRSLVIEPVIVDPAMLPTIVSPEYIARTVNFVTRIWGAGQEP